MTYAELTLTASGQLELDPPLGEDLALALQAASLGIEEILSSLIMARLEGASMAEVLISPRCSSCPEDTHHLGGEDLLLPLCALHASEAEHVLSLEDLSLLLALPVSLIPEGVFESVRTSLAAAELVSSMERSLQQGADLDAFRSSERPTWMLQHASTQRGFRLLVFLLVSEEALDFPQESLELARIHRGALLDLASGLTSSLRERFLAFA